MSSRFLANEIPSASVTCSFQLFPNSVIVSVSAARRARMFGSFWTGLSAFRVEPKATTAACLSGTVLMMRKNSMSLGLAPGHPPSM